MFVWWIFVKDVNFPNLSNLTLLYCILLKIQLVSPCMKKCQTTLPGSSIRQVSSDSIQHRTKQYSILIKKNPKLQLLKQFKTKNTKTRQHIVVFNENSVPLAQYSEKVQPNHRLVCSHHCLLSLPFQRYTKIQQSLVKLAYLMVVGSPTSW